MMNYKKIISITASILIVLLLLPSYYYTFGRFLSFFLTPVYYEDDTTREFVEITREVCIEAHNNTKYISECDNVYNMGAVYHGYRSDARENIFYGFFMLLFLSFMLLLCLFINSKKFFKFFRIAIALLFCLFILTIAIPMPLYYLGIRPNPNELPGIEYVYFESIDFLNLFFLAIYLLFFYLLTKKNWYSYLLISIGMVLFLSSVLFWILFLGIGLSSDFETNELFREEFGIESTRTEYLLGFTIPATYTMYTLLLITFGFMKKNENAKIWKKLLKYELFSIILFIGLYAFLLFMH